VALVVVVVVVAVEAELLPPPRDAGNGSRVRSIAYCVRSAHKTDTGLSERALVLYFPLSFVPGMQMDWGERSYSVDPPPWL
jgi:hypothetical protein